MRRSLAVSLMLLLAASLPTAACTEPGNGRAAADAGPDDAGTTDPAPDDAIAPDAAPADASRDAQDAAPPPLSLTDACVALAVTRCTRSDACTHGVAIATHWGDTDTCKVRVTSECLAHANLAGLPASAVSGCGAAYEAQSCSELGAGILPIACTARGRTPLHHPCGVSAQCDSGFCSGAGATCGHCEGVPSAGNACATSADCGDLGTLHCTRGRCAAGLPKGAGCSDLDRCAAGLSCFFGDGGTFGTCVPAAALGESCDPARIGAPSCDEALALHCNASHVCALPQVVTSGQLCGDLPGVGFQACATNGLCVRSDAGPDGSCVMPVADGEVCDAVAGPPCTDGALCVTTVRVDGPGLCMRLNPAACQ